MNISWPISRIRWFDTCVISVRINWIFTKLVSNAFYYPITQSRIQITREQGTSILRHSTVGCFVPLKPSLTGRLLALRFSFRFASPLMKNEQKHLAKKKSWIINDLLDVLEFSIAQYFCILTRPSGFSKYGTTRTQRYFTPKHLMRYLSQGTINAAVTWSYWL